MAPDPHLDHPGGTIMRQNANVDPSHAGGPTGVEAEPGHPPPATGGGAIPAPATGEFGGLSEQDVTSADRLDESDLSDTEDQLPGD